ncbi:DUF2339 domain-containing protein [Sphingomonas sp. 1P08PE]|uniref:DUF2339 domain-containing protein n=1 Tax=Sphingomonas sp. 1P08PE TaxID=554122 RepID=UPI0039A175AB
MILWSAIFMAAIGWIFSEFEEYGFVLGGIAGAVFGWGVRKAVRAEIERATAALRAQLDALRAPAPFAPAAQPERAPFSVPPPARIVATAAPEAEAPAIPPSPPEPVIHEPGVVEAAIANAIVAARGWLFGGNTIVRVGLVILFVGLSFLASYAASAGLFPIEFRLALVAAIGVALLAVGFRTRTARPDFGLALQGGGVAVIYLTLFAAAKLYATIPVDAAFALMIVVCALGCALALLQRSQALAVTAFAGGFAVPLLLSDGSGNVAGLFAYYTILNAAILFLAVRRSWRVVNLVGFFATFGVMTAWEAASYHPADFVVAQAFLIVSVLIYVACALLFARSTPGRLGGVVDTTLLFGPALAGFGLEVGLVHDRPFGGAVAALGFAALYLAVAGVVMRRRRDDLRVMTETLLAIGIGFVTLAVPLALGARWTSAAWALEGAGAFWVGMRQARWMPRMFGLAMQVIAAVVYIGSAEANIAAIPLANAAFVGAMLIALAALATAWWLRTPLPHSGSRFAQVYAGIEGRLGNPAFVFGFAFWWIAWAVEIARLAAPIGPSAVSAMPVFDAGTRATLLMLAYVASAWGAQTIGLRQRWHVATWPSCATLAAMALGFVGEHLAGSRVLHLPDAPIWIAAIALHLHALYRNDRIPREDDHAPARRAILGFAHAGGIWLATAILADCLLLGIDRGDLWRASWAEAALLLALLAALAGLTVWAGQALDSVAGRRRWPLDTHAVDYAWVAAAPLAAMLAFGTLLVALFSSGSADPLPYVPLLNPADLSLGLALATLELWRRTVVAAASALPGASALDGRGATASLATLAFVVVNTVWLRIAHHLLGVAWDPDALLDSSVVQTGIAILWTLLALALMIFAHRRARRALWLVGAGLLGLTVAKLLLIDLTNAGGGARIVAFIGVGILMLVVGYLAPLPPHEAAPRREEGSQP